jgi:hypothetical protein
LVVLPQEKRQICHFFLQNSSKNAEYGIAVKKCLAYIDWYLTPTSERQMSKENLTKRQFLDACKRRDFVPGFAGYFRVCGHAGGGGIYVHVGNAPKQTWSGRLQYLIQQQKQWESKQ